MLQALCHTCRLFGFSDKTVAPPECKKNTLSVHAAPDFNTDEVMIHAASLLKEGKHPFAAAVRALAQEQGIGLLSAAYVETRADQGWTGRVNGKICVLGKESLMAQAHVDTGALAMANRSLLESSHDVYFLSIGDHLAGLIGVPAHPQA